ncbi:zf-C2H2-2 domain containing protein [Pyrenophora tritici-repentis]|uniref:Zf-C2H2-2 domain containing protein n=2 Tax=Pyrenophora tritici-repentis TaxID=45151 RepID=A0A922NM03_9PLEO|nr:zf-C2H2-2 domain containing protein [Pyrenophora tritici-repentis]KAI1686082.1 zf-C2H2-2 domain containing protein [Pyrenophora tritici-repentis]
MASEPRTVVYNLRQKVAGNHVISEEEYNTLHIATQKTSRHRPELLDSVERMEKRGARIVSKRDVGAISQSSVKEKGAKTKAANHDPVPDLSPGTQCLFCLNSLPSPVESVHHMSVTHGLFIPRLDRIVDLECFLSYLGVLVYECRECVYCGAGKNTVQAVQTHMRDKGHCKIDMGELSDFWEDDEEESGNEEQEEEEDAGVSTTGLKPSSTARHIPIRRRPSSSNTALTQLTQTQKSSLTSSSTKHTQHQSTNRAEPLDTTVDTSCHQTNITPSSRDLTKSSRDLANLNLSLSQLRTLATLERRMKTQETTARARIQHKAERQPVKSVYYKTANPVYQAG